MAALKLLDEVVESPGLLSSELQDVEKEYVRYAREFLSDVPTWRAADLLAKGTDGPEIVGDYQRLTRNVEERRRLMFFQGRLLQRQGKHAEAVAAFAQAERGEREEIVLRAARARSLSALGRTQEAAVELEKLLTENCPGPRESWELWLKLAFGDLRAAQLDIVFLAEFDDVIGDAGDQLSLPGLIAVPLGFVFHDRPLKGIGKKKGEKAQVIWSRGLTLFPGNKDLSLKVKREG